MSYLGAQAAQHLRDALNEALEKVDNPERLVGRRVPGVAYRWAETNGLEVQETAFAPPGQLFIIGAIPVPWEEPA
jgi:hypothetical protein